MGLIRYLTHEKLKELPGIEPPEKTGKVYDIITAGNGVFVRATRPEFDVLLQHVPGEIRGLETLTPYIDIRLPRIPSQLLAQAFEYANSVADNKGARVESLFYFRYDEIRSEWSMTIPAQEAAPGWVKPLDTSAGSPFAEAQVELHSHHDLSLGARFSERDNLDESTRIRLFAVIGHTSTSPEIRLRVGIFGHFWEIPADRLFHLPANVNDSLKLTRSLRHERNGRTNPDNRQRSIFSHLIIFADFRTGGGIIPPAEVDEGDDLPGHTPLVTTGSRVFACPAN